MADRPASLATDIVDPRAWSVSVSAKGAEGEPVVVIDNFVTDPGALIEEAARSAFSANASFYPGVRADASAATASALEAALAPIFREHFGAVAPVALQGCFYSIVTKRPAELAPIQRLPHYDGVESGRYAFILYLCDGAEGGTSFYRHRATGFETVSRQRFDTYRRALSDDVKRHGLPPARYVTHDDPMFERIGGSPAVFNRALIYRGRNLHSGDIGADFRFDPDPRTGRLTLNGFLFDGRED